MKTTHTLALLCTILAFDTQAAMDHSRHRGMGGNSDKGGGNCVRPTLSKMQPAHLATVAPGSAFSFVLSNIDDPDQVSVQIKQQAVDIKIDFKDPYYVVSGKIPATLKGTAARVDVKVDSKIALCRMAEGWLIKITEN